MKHAGSYTPKRLATKQPLSQPGEDYSLYVLPSDTREITQEDLERFPPVLLGDEEAARGWLERMRERDGDPEVPARPPERKREKRRRFWGDLLFYAALAAVVVGVFLFRGAGDGAPSTFMGFSALRVLTGSMQDVIPQGSLIITRHVDPDTLEIGDDITYMAGEDTAVTHRIVAITENYGDTGKRAFTTQGVMNDSPDSLRVPAANVVGKVIFHNLFLGKMLLFIRTYWTWLAVLLALTVGLWEALRVVFRESGQEKKQAQAISSTGRQQDRRGKREKQT